jgi:hypothetical protein
MRRYAHGASEATWQHRQPEAHTDRGGSAAVQHSAMPCLTPTLRRWDYPNSPFEATLNQPNRRVRTRTHGGVGGAEPRGSPLSRLSIEKLASREKESMGSVLACALGR